MRIDPKDFSLDANERHVIEQALKMYCDHKARRIAAMRKSGSPRSKMALEQTEIGLARIQDVLQKVTQA